MKEKYDYYEVVKQDCEEYFPEFLEEYNRKVDWNELYSFDIDAECERLEECFRDECWENSSITGAGSGSYTYDREKAKEYVMDNPELISDCIYEGLLTKDSFTDAFLDGNWESLDCALRCFTVDRAAGDVVDEFKEALGYVIEAKYSDDPNFDKEAESFKEKYGITITKEEDEE